MAASTREKFDAAVNVIKSLPKNGSFQPSQELMLLFYGYFKQSTEGACNLPKPSFWEVVKKAKWDAWNKLGDMSREEAMLNYVEELKKIIETMPQTQMVAEFMETLGTFYELVEEKPLYNGRDKNEEGDLDEESTGNNVDDVNISRDLSLRLATVEEELRANGGDPDRDIMEPNLVPIPLKSQNSPVPEVKASEVVRVNGDVHRRVDVEEAEDDSSKDNTCSESTSRDNSGETSKDVSEETSKDTSQSTEDLESESEGEEFCDSTDQIQAMDGNVREHIQDEASTPLRAPRVTEVTSHRSDDPVTTSRDRLTMSPISAPHSARLTTSYLPFSPVLHRLAHLRPGQLSDSLAVNSPGDESLNTDLSQELSPTQGDTSSPEDPPMTAEAVDRPRYLSSRGGGDVSLRSRASYQLSRPRTSAGVGGTGHLDDQTSSRRGLFRHPEGAGSGGGSDDHWQTPLRADLSEQIAIALLRLQQDMNNVISRLDSLERLSQHHNRQTMWWPFPNLSGKSVFFVLAWPFVVHWLLNVVFKRRRR